MPPLVPNTSELVAGYAIKERIGAGGYGEVWKAEAPGGLTKAVKFVYGCLDGERAACEMKALQRIKEVRHPFLLSLERIEAVDGHLVIVTELADASLKDRCEQCREAGLPGIPRDELLVYLRDAAEALDYMSEHYSLQHLDVKPENLLIVGGRVKVADFGLVRQVQEQTVSFMGGLTPVYASPEVFAGHPSLHSDQYSLAIVYQEMLTGTLPFPGRSTAQLAEQHARTRPRLMPLPSPDREIIARALAKDPQQRFPSCRVMIDALLGVHHCGPLADQPAAGRPQQGTEIHPDTTAAASQATEVGGAKPFPAAAPASHEASPAEADRRLATRTLSLDEVLPELALVPETAPEPEAGLSAGPQAAPTVVDLPPIEIPPEPLCLRPTLLLGIGGTAGRILWRLRRRLQDRFGDLAAVPVFQTLLVDTDPKDSVPDASRDAARAFECCQTLRCPLRQPHRYRDDSSKLLQWLSRRWLYNIPRSLCTEGLRPLGRLAFVDHTAEFSARVRSALTAMTAPQALAAAQLTGLKTASDCPRVLVIASISGGTGSGMVLDAVYAVRKVLGELGLSDRGVCGILTHSTGRGTDAHKLAVGNAYACLSELQHYSRAGGYPGDPDCALPRFERNGDTFRSTYLLHLGNGLGELEFDKATDVVAKYLFLDLATAGGVFFEKCRLSDDDPQQRQCRELPLRTFAVSRLGVSQSPALDEMSPLLSACGGCRRVLLAVPEGSADAYVQDAVRKHLAGPPTVVCAPVEDTVLCCDAEQLPLGRVAAFLLGDRPDFAQIARRLHTRIDVAWTALRPVAAVP